MVPELRLDLYDCRHFDKPWVGSMDRQSKGLAGENGLYEALLILAKARKYQEVELLGRPDPAPDPGEAYMIGEKNYYPDCYLRVDDREYLFESKNIFFYFDKTNNWGGRAKPLGRLSPFFMEPASWVNEMLAYKKWDEPRYPIRGSGHNIRDADGKQRWEYAHYVSIHNIQSLTRVYVSTVPSYNGQKAWNALTAIFGSLDNMIFTHHPILSGEMCRDELDTECRDKASKWLTMELFHLLQGGVKA